MSLASSGSRTDITPGSSKVWEAGRTQGQRKWVPVQPGQSRPVNQALSFAQHKLFLGERAEVGSVLVTRHPTAGLPLMVFPRCLGLDIQMMAKSSS